MNRLERSTGEDRFKPSTKKVGLTAVVGTNPFAKCGINAWPPDFNNDKKVSLADVLAFIPVYLTVKGDGKYNSRFDLNADGKISLADILTLSPVFGKTCSL